MAVFCVGTLFSVGRYACETLFGRSYGEVTASGIALGCVWEAGKIYPSKSPTLTHEFEIRNSFHSDVQIKDVRTDCGCIVVKGRPELVPSGGVARIKVQFTPGSLAGRFARRVRVRFGGEIGELDFFLQGNIHSEGAPVCVPKTLDFGIVAAGTAKTRILRVANLPRMPAVILNPPRKGVSISLGKFDRDEPLDVHVTVQNDVENRCGSYVDAKLVLDSPTMVIPLRATLEGVERYFVRSVKLNLQKSKVHELPVHSLIAGVPPRIVSVNFLGDPELRIELRPDSEESEIDVEISDVALGNKILRGVVYLTLEGVEGNLSLPILVTTKPNAE